MAVNPFDTALIPQSEPNVIVSGTFVTWQRDMDGLDNTLYDVRYVFTPVQSVSTARTVIGVLVNGIATFEILSATLWASGEYRWDLQIVRKSDNEVAIVNTGLSTIFSTTDDRRSHAELMVTKIESLLSGRADSDIESYSIKNRSLTKMSVKELREWREYYLAEIERTGGSVDRGTGAKSNKIRVRFV